MDTELESAKNFEPKHHYTIEPVCKRNCQKFNTEISDYLVTFHDVEHVTTIVEVYDHLRALLTSILNELCSNVLDNDMVRMVLQSDSLDKPISIPYMKMCDVNADFLMSVIQYV